MSKSTAEIPISAYRKWKWFIHGCFLLLAILAVHFRYERLYADSSYYLLHTLDTGLPWVDHERYSLVLAELPALVALYAGSSLSGIILVYSLGHVLWAWLAAVWCMRMARPELAVAGVVVDGRRGQRVWLLRQRQPRGRPPALVAGHRAAHREQAAEGAKQTPRQLRASPIGP